MGRGERPDRLYHDAIMSETQTAVVPSGEAGVKTELTTIAIQIAQCQRWYDEASPDDQRQVKEAKERESMGHWLCYNAHAVRFLLRAKEQQSGSIAAWALTRRPDNGLA